MAGDKAKNSLILNILNVLREHSDSEHPLTQEKIIEYINDEYGMDVERKSIRRNIDNLIDLGYAINYSTKRKGSSGGTGESKTDIYFESEFDDSELKFLIDGLIFSKYITKKQRDDLINKLKKQTSEYFNFRTEHILSEKETREVNEEIFFNIAQIDDAIKLGKRIEFNRCEYDINKKLKLVKDKETNKTKVYNVIPFSIAASQGRYYLICKYDKYDDISNLRIDRIKNIKILDEDIDSNVRAIELNKHMREHIYMMGGESGNVSFDFNKSILTDVIDWFGTKIMLKENKDGTINAQGTINFKAMKFWALQYGDNVKVLLPKSVVDDIKSTIKILNKNYN